MSDLTPQERDFLLQLMHTYQFTGTVAQLAGILELVQNITAKLSATDHSNQISPQSILPASGTDRANL